MIGPNFFEILILATIDLVIVNKKTCRTVDFTVPANHRVKINENKEISTQTLPKKKLSNIKKMAILIVIGTLETILKGLYGIFRNQKTSRNHPNYSIVKIAQNTVKNPGDLMILAVT